MMCNSRFGRAQRPPKIPEMVIALREQNFRTELPKYIEYLSCSSFNFLTDFIFGAGRYIIFFAATGRKNIFRAEPNRGRAAPRKFAGQDRLKISWI